MRVAVLAATLLILCAQVSASSALAQAQGRLAMTFRTGANARAAVADLAGSLVLDGADIAVTPNQQPPMGTYAWDLSRDGRVVLMVQLDLVSMMSGGVVVRHELANGSSSRIDPPVEGTVLGPEARIGRDGSTVAFQYRAADGEPEDIRLGAWRSGTSRPLTGPEAGAVVAFALAPDGTILYAGAHPDGTAALYLTHVEGGEPRLVASLPQEPALVLNPSVTHLTIDEAGRRATLTTMRVTDDLAPTAYVNLAIDLATGELVRFGGEGTRASSISPDGQRIAAADRDAEAVFVAPFAEPERRTVLRDGLEVVPDAAIVWSPDGRHVAIADMAGADGLQPFVVPVEGGEAQRVGAFRDGLWNGTISWGEASP